MSKSAKVVVDAGLNYMLAPLNLTLEDLRAQPGGISIPGEPHYFRYRQDGFKTYTGKIEIFSEVFRNAGQHPLPHFVEPAMSPYNTSSDEFPLVLTSAKLVHYWTDNIAAFLRCDAVQPIRR